MSPLENATPYHLGDSKGQRGLACCSPWGCRVGQAWVTEQQQLHKWGSIVCREDLCLWMRGSRTHSIFTEGTTDRRQLLRGSQSLKWPLKAPQPNDPGTCWYLNLNSEDGNLSGGPVVKTLHSLQGTWIQSLGQPLRTRMLHSKTKKIHWEKKQTKTPMNVSPASMILSAPGSSL